MCNRLPQRFLPALFFSMVQLYGYDSKGQAYEKVPQPELALGIKVVTREIQYGKNHRYVTDPTSIGLQAGVRYDAPLKISGNRYIDLVGQAGFLFCRAKVFDTTFRDPGTNRFIRQHSHNPTYLPVYFGVYNMSGISLGAELFYWKGLGNRDIWGIKFLSLGYNGKQFRLAAAGEWYAQVKNGTYSGLLFSVDFFYKLISGRYEPK